MSNASEQVKKAKEVLEEISNDEHEQYLADLREKYILDQNNLLDTGFDRGLEQGLEQGSKQARLEMAKKLKDKGVDINIIIETTNLTKEEIEKL